MIKLNATFFVQVVHFLLAYVLIDRLLLRKVIALLMAERSLDVTLHRSIETEQQLVLQQEAVKKRRWQELQQLFAQESPLVDYSFMPSKKKQQALVSDKKITIAPEEMRLLEQQLLEKLRYVRN